MEKEVRMEVSTEAAAIFTSKAFSGQYFLIKDVRLNQTKDRSNVPKPATISFTVKLKRNKTVTCFPATAAATVTRTPTSNNNLQSHVSRSVKNCVSNETLVPRATTITTCTSSSAVGFSSSGGGSGGSRCRLPLSGDTSLNDHDGNQDCHVKAVIGNVDEMDPPLPVVQRLARPGAGGDEVKIWKRRFNGVALKSLQIRRQISPT